MEIAKTVEFCTFRGLPRFGVKGTPEALPKAYYSKLLELLGRRGPHSGRNVWILLKCRKLCNSIGSCVQSRRLHGSSCTWHLLRPRPQNLINPMVSQWFWRAPPPQNAKLTGNGEFPRFSWILVKLCKIHDFPHILVISMHFGVKDASKKAPRSLL